MPNIAVIGSYVVSLTVRVPRKPVMGEALIGDLFDMGPGGKGTNQAVAAARLGAQVELLACLGDDPFADTAESLFGSEGLATDHIHRISGTNTGVGLVTLMPSGDNWIVGHLGANLLMQPHHVEAFEPVIARSDVLMAQLEAPLETVARALELGRKHQATTILNPAPGQKLELDILANVDVLTPNESETRILLGLPPDDPSQTTDLTEQLLGLGVATIVVTRGENGRPHRDGGQHRVCFGNHCASLGCHRRRRQFQRCASCWTRWWHGFAICSRTGHSRRRLHYHTSGGDRRSCRRLLTWRPIQVELREAFSRWPPVIAVSGNELDNC